MDLLAVIVGGVIGVAGGVLGPALIHRLQSKDDKAKRLVAKFEELVSTVYEYDYWLEEPSGGNLRTPQSM